MARRVVLRAAAIVALLCFALFVTPQQVAAADEGAASANAPHTAAPTDTDGSKPKSETSDPAKPGTEKPAGPTAKSPPQGGTSAVVMDLSALESVIGKSVKSTAGEDLGRIVDLLVTTSGQVRAAVIDFGGILGVGSRKVAVDWKALDFSNFTKDGTVKLGLTRNQVRVSPEYKSGEPVVILQEGRPDDTKPDASKSDEAAPNNGDSKAGPTTGSPKDGVTK